MCHKLKIAGLYFCLLLLFSSCSNFKPASISCPKFEKRGQLNADVFVGTSFDANISYNPINHWAIMVNYTGSFDSASPDDEDKALLVDQNNQLTQDYDYKNQFYEVSTGFYWNYNENIYQDFYVGYGQGVGSVRAFTVFYESAIDGVVAFQNDFQNVFFQSSLRFNMTEMFDIGIHGRVNFLRYSNFKYVYLKEYSLNNKYGQDYSREEVMDDYFEGKDRVAYQFGITGIVKFKHFNFYQQLQLGIPETDYLNKGEFFNVRLFNAFFGISVPLNQFWQD